MPTPWHGSQKFWRSTKHAAGYLFLIEAQVPETPLPSCDVTAASVDILSQKFWRSTKHAAGHLFLIEAQVPETPLPSCDVTAASVDILSQKFWRSTKHAAGIFYRECMDLHLAKILGEMSLEVTWIK